MQSHADDKLRVVREVLLGSAVGALPFAGLKVALEGDPGVGIGLLQLDGPVTQVFKGNGPLGHRATHEFPR